MCNTHIHVCVSCSMAKQVDLPAGAGLARLWHTMAPCYLSSCEVELTVFGGAAENLFVQEEILCPNVDDTLVLHFGKAHTRMRTQAHTLRDTHMTHTCKHTHTHDTCTYMYM